jgi:hypothetical protein
MAVVDFQLVEPGEGYKQIWYNFSNHNQIVWQAADILTDSSAQSPALITEWNANSTLAVRYAHEQPDLATVAEIESSPDVLSVPTNAIKIVRTIRSQSWLFYKNGH